MEDGILDGSCELVAAVARRDAAAAAALYADDAWLLAPSAELIAGRGEIEAYWSAGLGVGLAHVELHALDIRVVDALAIEIGRYALTLAGDRDVVEGGKYVVLHRRQTDGSWRRTVEVFNPDEPKEDR